MKPILLHQVYNLYSLISGCTICHIENNTHMHLIAPITSTSVILMVCIIVGIIAPVISAKSKIVHKSIAIIIISCTSFVGCRHTRSKPDMSMTTNAAYDSVRRNTMTATVGETGPSMNPRPYINFIPMYETIDPVYDEITT